MKTFAHFIVDLLNRVGEYRATNRNQGAIAFIQRGAGLGLKAAEMLPTALLAHEKHAKMLLETRADDSGYRTILILAELLVPAATKQVFYAVREAERKDQLRARVQGYSLSTLGKDQPAVEITADAWATQTTTDQGADDTSHPGNDMGFETRGMENVEDDSLPVRFTEAQLREFTDQLVALLVAPTLRADAIVNSWRADYGTRPAIPFLVIPRADGTYTYADSVEKAIQFMYAMEDERAIRARHQQQREVAASVDSWKLPAKVVAA